MAGSHSLGWSLGAWGGLLKGSRAGQSDGALGSWGCRHSGSYHLLAPWPAGWRNLDSWARSCLRKWCYLIGLQVFSLARKESERSTAVTSKKKQEGGENLYATQEKSRLCELYCEAIRQTLGKPNEKAEWETGTNKVCGSLLDPMILWNSFVIFDKP